MERSEANNLPLWRHYGFRDGYHRLHPGRDTDLSDANPAQIEAYREGHKAGVIQRHEEDYTAIKDEPE